MCSPCRGYMSHFRVSSGLKVVLYRAQTGPTQCYNCQNFDHVWANCKQSPQCLWCGGGRLHRECPEKTNTESTPSCCNCTPVEGEKPHPASYRGCSHAKREQERRRAQRAPKGSSRTFFSRSPHQSSPTQLHYVKTRNTSNHRHLRQMGNACGTSCSSICHNRKFTKHVSQYRLPVRLTMKR
jgi:hypothetical protein